MLVVQDVAAFYSHCINSGITRHLSPFSGSSSVILAFRDTGKPWSKSGECKSKRSSYLQRYPFLHETLGILFEPQRDVVLPSQNTQQHSSLSWNAHSRCGDGYGMACIRDRTCRNVLSKSPRSTTSRFARRWPPSASHGIGLGRNFG